ncbi:RecQ family zinc-binding domain-containing protein [Nonomuraea sp. NPDC049709]|uniref:RecQ family zinc-binding domain-containing protein n=1 Tax=Nonomuraea sp. NPDC049709 TaxID=3154736 RepID=UPI0034454113
MPATYRGQRRFLLGYFGEQLAEPCGNCDRCLAGTADRQQEETGPFPRTPVWSIAPGGRARSSSAARTG